MNQNEVDKIALILKQNQDTAANLIFDMFGEYEYLAREIRLMSTSIAQNMETVRKRADHHGIINEMGELQQLGHRFDILCSRYAVLQRQLYPFIELLKSGDDNNVS